MIIKTKDEANILLQVLDASLRTKPLEGLQSSIFVVELARRVKNYLNEEEEGDGNTDI